MPSLLVICPSRGRPARARAMYESFIATKRLATTDIVFVLHHSDPECHEYERLFDRIDAPLWYFDDALTLPQKLNAAAAMVPDVYDYIQFAADDMLYRTVGWDAIATSRMRVENVAFGYANDLIRHDIANHVFADLRAVRALGWFALPTSEHLYLDNVWMALGTKADSIRWFSDVVIEHLHPLFGRGSLDASYRETNSVERYERDGAAYDLWRDTQLEADAETVREAMRADRGRHADGWDGVTARPADPQGPPADLRR